MTDKEQFQLTPLGRLVAVMLKHGVDLAIATAISQDIELWEAALNHLSNTGFILPGGINPDLTSISKIN